MRKSIIAFLEDRQLGDSRFENMATYYLYVFLTLQITFCYIVCASNPEACCTPKQWQATIIQDGSSISQKKGLGVSLLTGKLSVFYDAVNKRVRIDEENSLNPVNFTTIHDLGKVGQTTFIFW